jgi:hypothetical protein
MNFKKIKKNRKENNFTADQPPQISLYVSQIILFVFAFQKRFFFKYLFLFQINIFLMFLDYLCDLTMKKYNKSL